MQTEINNSLEVLIGGGIILYPTETVFGIGCDATNEQAIEKVYKIKQRNEAKSLIILVNNDAMLNKYVEEVPAVAWDIMDYSESPVTIVYPAAKNLPKKIIASDGSIAIRKTTHPFCNKLIEKLKKPLVSTSANISGEHAPSSLSKVNPAILKEVDYVVNLPETSGNTRPSSIIKVGMKGEIKIIRK